MVMEVVEAGSWLSVWGAGGESGGCGGSGWNDPHVGSRSIPCS